MVGGVTEDTPVFRPEGKEERDAYAYREVTQPGFGRLFGREDMIRRVRGEVINRLRRDAVQYPLGQRTYVEQRAIGIRRHTESSVQTVCRTRTIVLNRLPGVVLISYLRVRREVELQRQLVSFAL